MSEKEAEEEFVKGNVDGKECLLCVVCHPTGLSPDKKIGKKGGKIFGVFDAASSTSMARHLARHRAEEAEAAKKKPTGALTQTTLDAVMPPGPPALVEGPGGEFVEATRVTPAQAELVLFVAVCGVAFRAVDLPIVRRVLGPALRGAGVANRHALRRLVLPVAAAGRAAFLRRSRRSPRPRSLTRRSAARSSRSSRR